MRNALLIIVLGTTILSSPIHAAPLRIDSDLHGYVFTNGKRTVIVRGIVPEIARLGPDRGKQALCVAMNALFETGMKRPEEALAVSLVVRNRTTDTMFPDTFCAVVWDTRYKPSGKGIGQFSWTHARVRSVLGEDDARWTAAQHMAARVVTDLSIADITNGATHFWSHCSMRRPPAWAKYNDGFKKKIGCHTFVHYAPPWAPVRPQRINGSLIAGLGY
jgi:spore germination cell wall hydrolase CwlJ-like protein